MHLPASPPFLLLARHASASATGEFIAAGDDVEVHVFLQAGRIAWGTTSAERFVFRRHLEETVALDPAALKDVVEECQRSRRPLGETLVAWGLASLAQVRDALRAQVAATLRSLSRCGSAQTLFLPRGATWASYDPALTFELGEFSDDAPPPAPLASSPSSANVVGQSLLERLLESAPSLSWACALSGRQPVTQLRGPVPPSIPELASRIGADVDLVAIRASGGSVLGGSVDHQRTSVWCGLPPDAGVANALWTLSAMRERPAPTSLACQHGPFEAFGESTQHTGGLEAILERAGCPVGAAVLDGGGAPDLWAVARAPLAPEELGRLAVERQRVLDADVFSTRRAGPSSPARGLAFQSALLADQRFWWFGTDLVGGEPASLWLALPRAASQGLGWALLATLARHLASAEHDE